MFSSFIFHCFCDIPIYYSLRSVIHLSTSSYPFFFPPAASSLELYCTESSYSHLHLSTAEIGREQERTASVPPPLHSFLPAAVVKHIRPRLRDGKDIPIFLLPVLLFFFKQCLTMFNLTQPSRSRGAKHQRLKCPPLPSSELPLHLELLPTVQTGPSSSVLNHCPLQSGT